MDLGARGGVLRSLLALNVAFLLAFWLARVLLLLLDGSAFAHVDGRPVEPWSDGLYHSFLTQSTVGSSDLLPVSGVARLLTSAQSATTLLSLFLMAEWGRRRLK